MKVIALKDYTDNRISIYEGQIREVSDILANQLIAKKVCGTSFPDDISITPSSTAGTEIADIKINGQSNKIYAPSGGSEGGSAPYIFEFIVESDDQPLTFTKTYNEIVEIFNTYPSVIVKYIEEATATHSARVSFEIIEKLEYAYNDLGAECVVLTYTHNFYTNDPDGYPTWGE